MLDTLPYKKPIGLSCMVPTDTSKTQQGIAGTGLAKLIPVIYPWPAWGCIHRGFNSHWWGYRHQQIIMISVLILGFLPANERHCYKVTLSLIGWLQNWNQHCDLQNVALANGYRGQSGSVRSSCL